MPKEKHLIGAIATLVGTVIGAGILGIPYTIAQSGFLIGVMHIIIVGLAVTLVNLYVGEIALRTEGRHQLTGYASKYLGKWGRHIMFATMVISIYGALIAYIIGEGASLNALLGIDRNIAAIMFFCIMTFFIIRGLKLIEGAEVWLNAARGIVLLALLGLAAWKIDLANLATISLPNSFMPYGVVLFAFVGAAVIPELKEELMHNKRLLKKAILWGMAISMLVYVMFTIATVGVTGSKTTEIATIGLGEAVGKSAIAFGNFFAIISMATAFLALGLALKYVFVYDYKMNAFLAILLTCFVPLAIAMIAAPAFTRVLSISGAIAGGLEGIMIFMMHLRARKNGDRTPEYSLKPRALLNALLVALFAAGIAYTLLTL